MNRDSETAANFTSSQVPDVRIVAQKASGSLSRHQGEVVRNWLSDEIESLDLASLRSFPTDELAAGLPELVAALARLIGEPGEDLAANPDLKLAAARIATLRRDESDSGMVIDDYMRLKKMIVEAAGRRLRASDRMALVVSERLDDGFGQILKTGFEAFIDRRSQKLQQEANTDSLTGLYNVRFFRRQLHQNLEMYKRYHIPFSLLMIDLDRLKQLNDARGHQAGDAALRHLASILSAEKRETDVAVRYGGDEFFMVMPGVLSEDAERLARRVSSKAQSLNLKSGGREMTGVSIGIVACPTDGTDVGALRSKADRALYLAKSLGGATVAGYREFSLEPQAVF